MGKVVRRVEKSVGCGKKWVIMRWEKGLLGGGGVRGESIGMGG